MTEAQIAGHTLRLLRSRVGQQPTLPMFDFWRTLSECLTELAIDVDLHALYSDFPLQPQLLGQLTALTKLRFHVAKGQGQGYFAANDVLDLPELKVLHIEQYDGRQLVLECPKLTHLTAECSHMGPVFLQAPLQGLYARSSSGVRVHTGFPVSNFVDLVSLSIECSAADEEVLFSALPLMQDLQTLDLGINQGILLQCLPHSLCEVTLHPHARGWDNAIIPVLQQLPDLKNLEINIQRYSHDTLAMLSGNLRPFVAMQKLCTFQLGPWKAWTPSSFKALGQFEVELTRSGSNLKLIY